MLNLYDSFDCMFISYQVRISEWIHTLYLPEYQEAPCSNGTVYLTSCSYHVIHAFQSEFALYTCLNVKELLAPKWRDIWKLSDCNRNRTNNHLVRKGTLNHLGKLTNWLSWVVSAYLYQALYCMLLSCYVRISEWIHTLYMPECQGTLCSKQFQYFKFKWLQGDSNPQPVSS